MSPDDSREPVTTAVAARLLNLSQNSVQSAILRGRMQAEKRGGRWFVPMREIDRYRMFHLHTQPPVAPMPDRPPRRKRHGGGRRKRSDEV